MVCAEGHLLVFGKACPGQIKVASSYSYNSSKAADCREQDDRSNEEQFLQCCE